MTITTEPANASHDPTVLPPGMPIPVDDGAAAHLQHSALPAVTLRSTDGSAIRVDRFDVPIVVFTYPRTGIPGQAPSRGFNGEEWDSIPGARGCTPQSCGFRDLHPEFERIGVRVLGCSTQTTEFQQEFRARQHIPFHFLSDSDLHLARALSLPTLRFPIESGGPNTLLRRMAFVASPDPVGRLRIRHVWYPVFPPDRNAADVLAWLRRRYTIKVSPASEADLPFVRAELARHWGGSRIWSLERAFDADKLPALVARVDGRPVGLVTYTVHHGGYLFEIITISVVEEGRGIGERLLEAAADEGRRARCVRAMLTTTNDNLRAIGFYQQQGWAIAALHRNAVSEARRRKPAIPYRGKNGIPVRDEIEMELWLEPGAAPAGTSLEPA